MSVVSAQYIRDPVGNQTTTSRTVLDDNSVWFVSTDGGTPPRVLSLGKAGAALQAWIEAGNTISSAA